MHRECAGGWRNPSRLPETGVQRRPLSWCGLLPVVAAMEKVMKDWENLAAVADFAHRQWRSRRAQALIERPQRGLRLAARARTGFTDLKVCEKLGDREDQVGEKPAGDL